MSQIKESIRLLTTNANAILDVINVAIYANAADVYPMTPEQQLTMFRMLQCQPYYPKK
ncbi:hypothetical protein pb186bvf_018914 [Paramecium bursaria]